MKNTPNLYNTLNEIFGQHQHWLDKRHYQTLAWMVVGLISSGLISLPEWVPYVDSRANFAQSTVRRFRRWLENDRIQVNKLYGVVISEALSEWGENTLYLALDTSMLWNQYCLIRVSVIYRGRAVPLVWQVIEHGSSTIAFETYRALLDQAYAYLPLKTNIIFLADRGFADTDLMRYLSDVLKWHWRIRIKSSFYVSAKQQAQIKVSAIHLQRGEAQFWHHVFLTKTNFGLIHLALAKPLGSKDVWLIASDQPTHAATFDEYGLRFDIEENFLDDKSNGFQLESSLLRSPAVLTRLCAVLAFATLFLVAQGTEVVESGLRRLVDAHWFRGQSYLQIGWKWVKRSAVKGFSLISILRLSSLDDPEPAMASKKQHEQRTKLRLSIQYRVFST